MLFRYFLITLSLSFTLDAHTEDRRKNPSELLLMTFNAEFLWDGIVPEDGSEQVQFPWRGSPQGALEHMQEIAEVIIEHDPDIVNLIEVENLDALNLFNQRFLSGRGYKPYLVDGKDTFTGQDVALLTRIDPLDERIYFYPQEGRSGNIQRGVTKNYYARFVINGRRIALIGVHFLANPGNRGRMHDRQAQADAIKNLAIQLHSEGYRPIVLGDLNDYDGDTLDHIDSRPISKVLSIIKAMGTPSDPSDDLVNLLSLVPKNRRYTAFYDRNDNDEIDGEQEFTAIDHILVHNDLADEVREVWIHQDYDPRQVSDHFPIIARFDLSAPFEEEPIAPAQLASVFIHDALPNPAGDETQNEEISLINRGERDIDLDGWILRDKAKTIWALNGLTLRGNSVLTIKRLGKEMALNNGGDTIELINPSGTVVHTVTYSSTREGERILFENE